MDVFVEARRIVNNRFFEDHPFRWGAGGIHEFAELVDLVPKLSDDELRHIVDRWLDLLRTQWGCCACYCKVSAFGELIARPRWPEDAKVFAGFLDERVAEAEAERRGSTGDRDFREEVRFVIGLHVPDFDARN